LAGCSQAGAGIGSASFGKPGKLSVASLYTFLGFFLMVSYVDVSADCIEGLLHEFWMPGIINISYGKLQIGVWLLLLAPTTLVRSMKHIAVLSAIASCAAVVLVVTMLVVCGGLLLSENSLERGTLRLFPDNASDFLLGMSMILPIFAVQGGSGAIFSSMQNQSSGNLSSVTIQAFALSCLMLGSIGSLGYSSFGDATKGDVILNLPHHSAGAIVMRIALLVLVLLSYTIMSIPCKVCIIDVVFGKNEALLEASKAQFCGTLIVINLSCLSVARFVTDTSIMFAINGAFVCNALSFMMPTLVNMKIRAKDAICPQSVPMLSSSNVSLWCVFGLGAISFLFSTHQFFKMM